MTNNKNKTPLKLLLGIPVLLLILSLFLTKNKDSLFTSINSINPYFPNMPNAYAQLLSKVEKNDSTFYCSVFEDLAIRELVIFKTFPSIVDVKQDFTVELYPLETRHRKEFTDYLTLNLTKDAVVFNSDNKAYGVFKMELPIIDIKKIVIKQNGNNSKNEPWYTTIEKPFRDLDKKALTGILQDANDKSQPYQPNPYISLFIKTLKNHNIDVLSSFYSERNDSLFKTNEDINDYCNSSGKTIGKITQHETFWNGINNREQGLLKQIKFVGVHSDQAKQLLMGFINESSAFEEVFNVEKLALFNALKNVFVDNCNEEIYLAYNTEENILEPFYVDSNCSWTVQKFVRKPNIKNHNYLVSLVKALDQVSNMDFYSTLIKDNVSFKYELALINNYNTNIVFNKDVIKANQNAIKKSLNPSSALKVELISVNPKKMIVSAFNLSNYPIEVLGLNHLDKKEITSLNPVREISSGQRDTITINLPRSFENLFVSKKKKVTGFVLPKHIYDLNIQYHIVGVNKNYATSIIPYQKSNNVKDDLFRTSTYTNNHQDIVIEEEKKEISFSKDSVMISTPLVIKKGYTFKLNPGTIVNIMEGGKIVSHSPLSFIGSETRPIKVYSSDKRGQGILVLSKQKKSTLKYVVFDQLRNPTHGSWGVTGAVTFYESPVELEHVSVKNNKCEDALNIVRTNFTMNQVSISNTQSDAFDGDFVKGSILNCQFDNLGNDAIDVSGSDLVIKNVIITGAGDKGLSAGEDSIMTVDGADIHKSAIAIAGKDLSIINAKNLKISETKLGFTAFQKKPEFGPSQITVNGVSMKGIETKYLIESSSSLFVDNKKIETTQNVKDRMYGVEFGRSSDETRNTPQ
ncbi:hypothetical protein [Winogradskyella pulchriflava]|uniref:Right handed beta helix domain-containing protein n=1 Tax=Winogradskyella pulchriflava TaxID=1110688 RepID=A0ABV6Q573_9FLAO